MTANDTELVMLSCDGVYEHESELLAKSLNIRLVRGKTEAESCGLSLCYRADGLVLTGDGLEIKGDFTRLVPRLKQNNLQGELLVKASRIKDSDSPTAVDATAGLGEDAFLLAASGFSVTMYEYDSIISVLLRDALKRALEIPELADIASRMKLIEGDSITALPKLSYQPDVILLDPMFPEKRKSALVKKKFQLIHRLEQPCSDENALLQAAISAQPRKIVVKRPAKGKFLGGVKPTFSLNGNAIRYDCIVLPRGN